MLRGMSYRFLTPLSLVATALFTALVIGVVMAWHTYSNVRIELIDNGHRLGHALASAIRPALAHDDVWLAYSILRGPYRTPVTVDADFIVVDRDARIFASNRPRLLPVALPLESADPALAAVLRAYTPDNFSRSVVEFDALPDRLLLVTPVMSDGETMGLLLQAYPRTVLWPRFASIIQQGGISVLLVLAVIVPIGWFWGHRMVVPLLRLAACMARVREERPEQIECVVIEGNDEIGLLNARFRELLTGLREKAVLERQMVASERLAAVGQLASGVAHEINNPLGGMLLAIDTLRKRGVSDTRIERTLSLLERGLRQIQETVSALLVEAKSEHHSLTAQDIEDTRTLVNAQSDKGQVTIAWNNSLAGKIALPSTPIRQVVINLLLNALQSAPRGGEVKASFRQQRGALQITVSNDGETIEQKMLDHLFEPYYGSHRDGSGLGLWVTYQIVQQLGGRIEATSIEGETCFRVTLPVQARRVQYHAA